MDSNRETLIKSTDPVPVVITPPDPLSLTTESRLVFAILGLLFFSVILVALIVWGDPKNTIHVTALQWSFISDIGILGGLGFGQLMNLLPYLVAPKKQEQPAKKA